MKDVSVKAKAKLGNITSDYLLDSLIRENKLDVKIDYLSKNYKFISPDDNKVDVEDKLINNFFDNIRSLEYFLIGLEKQFYQMYFSKFKIYLIQDIITSILNKSLVKNYKKFMASPFYKSMKIEKDYTFEDFVKNIDDIHVKRVLEPFLNKNMDKDSIIFLSSNALIKAYYRDLLKLSKKFSSKESEIINVYLAKEINLLNFEMLYRLKFYFDVNNNEIFNYLIEGGYLFNGEKLREISSLDNEEFMKYISKSKYKSIFKEKDFIYKNFQERRLKLFKDEIIKERSDVLYVISVMNVLYIDIKNIICLLEMDDKYTYSQKKELLVGR